MEKLIQDIFVAAGVKSKCSSDAMTRLEQWLDMETVTPTVWDPMEANNDDEFMEDCAPFSSNVYRSVGLVLVEAWTRSSTTTSGGDSSNKGIFSQSSNVSLVQVPSVRVTRWLRQWMSLNVMGSSSTSDEDVTFSQLLLRHCEGNTTGHATGSSKTTENAGTDKEAGPDKERRVPRIHILKALFHHIAELPQLQHQVHAYTQGLLHRKPAGGNISTKDRLEQLKASNEVSERLSDELDVHLQHVEEVLGEWYLTCNPTLRASCRMSMGRVWQSFVNTSAHAPTSVGMGRLENTSACAIAMTLNVLDRILMGASHPFQASHEHLVFNLLVPLHKPSGMVLWRDQTPLLDLYHLYLVHAMATLLKQEWRWIPRVVSQLLLPDIWPSSQGTGSASANTPKVVLLLHEIDTFLGLFPKPISTEMMDCFHDTIGPLTVRLGSCISSDNSRMSERALQFFKNENFVAIIKHNLTSTLPTLLRALCRTSDQMQLPWNPTVRKMTRLVLQELESYDQQAFARACRSLFGGGKVPQLKATIDPSAAAMESAAMESATPHEPKETASDPVQRKKEKVPVHAFSLRAGMGDWRPPPSSRGRHSNKMLPPPARPPSATSRSGRQPPSTITGVAPWAMNPKPAGGTHKMEPSRRLAAKTVQGQELSSLSEEPDTNDISDGLARVQLYMDQLKPSSSEGEDEQGTSSWAMAQMAESPTLLPALKFHDLVFGDDLGSGAFGSVKYARQIIKSKTRSHWPEYAVKIVSTQKIEEMGYEQSINREIATLRVMSHPGIARLISSFRFRDGAYLVLEYASGGDLHTLLKEKGSLDEKSTRFVVGSVVAALWSIHEMGFVYGDLKPENILITETGHIKLTDFGGCRPVSQHAKEMIRSSGKNLLKELRDGDWKPKGRAKRSIQGDDESGSDSGAMEVEEEEDLRVEGTTAYLPPEVVIGGIPTLAADSWALGCVLYQCISGRPPILDDDDAVTRNKIVAFHLSETEHDSRETLFTNSHDKSTFSSETQSLVLRLLGRDPASRPNMLQISEDKFFAGTKVFSLHKNPGYPLDVGSVAPVEHASWSRRQFSSIWAPQPKAYNFGRSSGKKDPFTAPISEGEEAAAFFSKGNQQSSFRNIIPENVPVA